MSDPTPLSQLHIADPETYVWVKGRVALMDSRPSDAYLKQVAEETIWALSIEPGLGKAVARGILRLGPRADRKKLSIYIHAVRQAAMTGPTLARILATHLVAVLMADAGLLERFEDVVRVMRGKGTYTLSEPLEVLGQLLDSKDIPSAKAYLDLLATTFGQTLSYNRSVRLVHVLPQSVRGFVVGRRAAQITQLSTVVKVDPHLIDPFLEGMHKGVALLAAPDLERFVAEGLALYRQSSQSGAAFLALASTIGRERHAQLLKAVPLVWFKGAMDRYVNARLGRARPVKPMSALSAEEIDDHPWVCSDGQFLYLRDEIDRFDRQSENTALGKMLVRLEAGFFEYRTGHFDLERAVDLFPIIADKLGPAADDAAVDICDAARFTACFDQAILADDLMGLFELGRVVFLSQRHYPGLMRGALPLLRAEAGCMLQSREERHLLFPLYSRLVLNAVTIDDPTAAAIDPLTRALETIFCTHITTHSTVETCAALVCMAYDQVIAALAGPPRARYSRMDVPFGWRVRWELMSRALAGQAALSERIKAKLAEQGVKIYRSDLQSRLTDQNGRLSVEDIKSLVVTRDSGQQRGSAAVLSTNGSNVDLAALFQTAGIGTAPIPFDGDVPVFHYPEWDVHLQDYLGDHARVQEAWVPVVGGSDFYRGTLERHRGLVSRMRRAFELLKPQGLVMLRPWPEGDAFDHRALIDFVVDRRAGRIPSDRLFIKRLKQERDVAVLLLVDLSRSTANSVAGGRATVLEVAKEALVLFCEALQVVGDTYAIAGFSGTGRHAVDYFRIKGFLEPLDTSAKERISGLTPQRSTRMGAALRHATAQLAQMPSRVRLLILVSDGFPNDLGYKGEYAIADTRRAVQEARARNVHVKAITVNIGSDPQLDAMYGRVHHHVIGDVRELPDKLLRLYGVLTRRD
jgi:nitric oxide reductase NorD protein